MRFWMSGEIDLDVYDAYCAVSSSIEQTVNDAIKGRRYGSGVAKFAYIATIIRKNVLGWKERRRFTKKDKVAELRLFVDHRKFKAADSKGQFGLICNSIIL